MDQETQLAEVVLIVVLFMFSGLTTQTVFVPRVSPKTRSCSCGQFNSYFACVSNEFNF